MSVLHVLRGRSPDDAAAVIRAQAEAGVEVRLLLLQGARAPAVDAPRYAVAEPPPEGARPVTWGEALELLFAADTVVTW